MNCTILVVDIIGQYGHKIDCIHNRGKIEQKRQKVEIRTAILMIALKKSEAIILFSPSLYDGVIACCQNMNDRVK